MSRKLGGPRQPEMVDKSKALHQTAEARQGMSLEARETARLQEKLEGLLEEIRHAPTRNDKRALHEIMRSKLAEHDARIKRFRREPEPQGVSSRQEHQTASRIQQQQTSMVLHQKRPHEDKNRLCKEYAKPLPETARGVHWGKRHMEKLREKARKQRKKAEKKVRTKDLENNVAESERAVKKRRKEGQLERKRREDEEAVEKQPAEQEHPRQQHWHDTIQGIRFTNSSIFYNTDGTVLVSQHQTQGHDTSQEIHSTVRNSGATNNFHVTSGLVLANITEESFQFGNTRSIQVDIAGVTMNGAP